MRPFLAIVSFLVTNLSFGQSLSDKYLHYKTDYYWDTTLYMSAQVYYYEVVHGKITQKEYPVLRYMYTKIISDTPLVTKDTFERGGWSEYPYKYVKKGNNIYLQYFDLGKRKLQLNKEYSLNRGDTVKWLADKNSLNRKDGISIGGSSSYLGEEMVEINGKHFKTYHFSEKHPASGIDGRSYIDEVFLEQTNLIPIKFITKYYHDKTGQTNLYVYETALTSSSNSLPSYTNQTTKDLILYENSSTRWTEPQKQTFLKMFSSDNKSYAECLLKKLDGYISFYHFEQTLYFKNLLMEKACE